jgi:hypothetical protein
MYENMVGPVGFAMHEDRLAQTTKKMRLTEAEQGRRVGKEAAHRGYRAGIAVKLVALATRLAPTVTAPLPPTRALARRGTDSSGDWTKTYLPEGERTLLRPPSSCPAPKKTLNQCLDKGVHHKESVRKICEE